MKNAQGYLQCQTTVMTQSVKKELYGASETGTRNISITGFMDPVICLMPYNIWDFDH